MILKNYFLYYYYIYAIKVIFGGGGGGGGGCFLKFKKWLLVDFLFVIYAIKVKCHKGRWMEEELSREMRLTYFVLVLWLNL